MSNTRNHDQLALFERSIHSRIAHFQQGTRCRWCLSPNYPVRSKGLCSSCYKWDSEQNSLASQVAQLPSKTRKDPHFLLRHYLDVADSAVKLCKSDGAALQSVLDQASALDLEHTFDGLSKRILGSRRGSRLFHGRANYFYDFSPPQRAWIGYMVSIILHEMNRRDRREMARRRSNREKNKAAEAKMIAHPGHDIDPAAGAI